LVYKKGNETILDLYISDKKLRTTLKEE